MEQAYKYNELRQHEISGIPGALTTSALFWSVSFSVWVALVTDLFDLLVDM